MDRRTLLQTVSSTVIGVAIAGCTDGAGGGQETGTATGSPTGTETTTATATQTSTNTGGGTETGTPGDIDVTLPPESKSPQGIEVTNVNIERTSEGARVTGTVKNTGNNTYDELEVQATLMDDTDDVVGQYFDNSEGEEFDAPLEPGEEWNFSIDFPRADIGKAAKARIDIDTSIDQDVHIPGIGTTTGTSTGTSTGTGG